MIPPLAGRTAPIRYDKPAYRGRNRVERLFRELQQFRRIATRYDTLDETFLASIHLASARIMTREFVNTA